MSERKVLNKYYPPNFDPSRIPKRIVPKGAQHTVRLMAPFSMQCSTCGEFIYKGRKFNARKETVEGEMYLTIKIFRFYIRCPICAAEITFKTDPKNADYVSEHGAKRNFEPWRDEIKTTEEAKTKRILEEMNNPMKALENKTFDSKREIEIMESLDELRMANAQLELVDTDRVFAKVSSRQDEAEILRRQAEEQDELHVQKAFAAKRAAKPAYEGWSDEEEPEDADAEPDEVVGELPLEQPSLVDSGLVVQPAIPQALAAEPTLSKAKRQALLGIKKKT